jgi:hypothetical protein
MRERHRGPVKSYVEALIEAIFPAILASATGSARIDGNKVTANDLADTGSDRLNITCYLVTQYHRFAQSDHAEATVIVVVQIRTADAARCHGNQNLAGSRRARVSLFNAQIPGGVDDDSFHMNNIS